MNCHRLLGIAAGRPATQLPAGADLPAGSPVVVFIDDGTWDRAAALDRIDRHLAAGGAALIAIEPERGGDLGAWAPASGCAWSRASWLTTSSSRAPALRPRRIIAT